MSIQVREFKHIPGENDAEYIKLLKRHIDQQNAIIRKAVTKLTMGCHGCVHYDQQQTAMICRECRRYYKDKHSDFERRMNDGVDSKRTKV